MSNSSHIPEGLTIEQVHGSWWLCEHGTYSQSSVLAGQDYRQLVKSYDSVELAVDANPGVVVDAIGYAPVAWVPDVAPADFDPAYAGERWNEED